MAYSLPYLLTFPFPIRITDDAKRVSAIDMVTGSVFDAETHRPSGFFFLPEKPGPD